MFSNTKNKRGGKAHGEKMQNTNVIQRHDATILKWAWNQQVKILKNFRNKQFFKYFKQPH